MVLRDRQRKSPAELNESALLASEEDTDMAQLVQTDQTLELVAEGLKELNAEQQQCVTLFYLERKTYQEITDITGFTYLQVKSYIQNGKRNLRIWVEKKQKDNSQ
jgi:RNA polymerase sigma-70 factor (ECF subfamily)